MNYRISRILLLVFVLVQGTLGYAGQVVQEPLPSHENNADAHSTEHEEWTAGSMIIHHIMDAHEWHLWDWNGHPVSFPLPIIIYDEARGLLVFSSSRFEHGTATYNGYGIDHEKIEAVDANGEIDVEATSKIWDLSITKNAFALLISVGLMLFIFISVASRYKKHPDQAPKGMQALLEPIILFVRDDIAKVSIKHNYERYMPYLLTIFFFIWINNIMGLIPFIPGGANVTGNVAVPMVMALFTFVITLAVGNKHYWQHILWMPGVPVAIKPLMMVIELAGVFIKPIVLVIRLFANITAGHIVILVFISLIFIFGDNGTSNTGGLIASIPATAFAIFLNMLEILVGAIQAYVFTLLSAVYFGMATDDGH
jgi:F-type H+-transporting ATPase subunit a